MRRIIGTGGSQPAVRSILTIELIILAAAGVVSLVSGQEFGTVLLVAGVIAIVLGALSTLGGTTITRNFVYQQAESVGTRSLKERAEERIRESEQDLSFLVLMAVVGGITVVLGILVRNIAG